MGIMTSLNKIGPCWAGGSYGLLQEILHNEWGFNGNIVTDSYSGSWSNGDMMIRAGANLALGSGGLKNGTGSATAVNALRNAAQGILYSHANSMAMNRGSSPTKPRAILSFETSTLKTGIVNIEYSASVANAIINSELYPDANPTEIVYTLKEGSALPVGLVLNPDGSITGTPTEEMPFGNFTVVATFADDARETSFTISVIDAAGSIVYTPASSTLAIAGVGKEYNVSVAEASIVKPDATQEEIDKFPAVTYSLADGSLLPKGLTLNSDGTISGTPTVECENYEFTVVASALGYKDRTATYTISIFNELTFEAIDLMNGKFGEDYFVSIANATCVNKVTYSLKSGSYLPKGLTLTAGGLLVGKPMETVTNYEFTVVASAPFATEVEATFKISVGVIFNSNLVLAHGEEGTEYFGFLSASGAGNIKYALKDGCALPEGLTLNEDGSISGTPTKAGIYYITVVVNADGKIGDETDLTLYIANNVVEKSVLEKFLGIFGQATPSGKKEN
jgi:beta-glucosidase